MTTKREFEATEGLLHDVMRKQAGSVEKAVLEGVMNSVDAGATQIDVQIDADQMTISDNGTGMARSDIESYFEKFGLKDDDIEEKEFGKFRMGRGQIFNFGLNIWHTGHNILVVNLNEDETNTEIDGEEVTLDTSGLSYNLLDTDENVDGCDIRVDFYETLDDVRSTVTGVRKLIEFIPWLHNVEITINGDAVSNEAVSDVEIDSAYFLFEPEEDLGKLNTWSDKTAIYNKGAYVKKEDLGPVSSVIVTKVDLDVNFARNDILDNDTVWRDIREEFLSFTADYLIEKRDLTQKEAKWLLDRAKNDDALLMRARNIPMVPDIDGDKWSISELSDQEISYSHSGDKAAKDIMEQSGVLFVDESFKGKLEQTVENSDFLEYDDVLEKNSTFEMSVIEDEDLSTKRRERLAMARWYLLQVGFSGEVKAGYSQNANVWMDGDDVLYIHKGLLNEKKMDFLTEGLDEILEVAAHDRDTRQGRDHDISFCRDYWDMAQKRAEPLKKLLNGNAPYERY